MAMKKIQILNRYTFLLMLGIILLSSCSKDKGDYGYINNTVPYAGNSYEYLKSKPGLYDSLLFVIDRLKLTDTLKNNKVTLFAVTNKSFQQVVEKLNIARKLRGKPAIYLKDIAPELLDSMVCRYIIRGHYLADSLTQTDGKMLTTIRYLYPMNGKLATANASGYKGGGPAVINYYFTKKSNFTKDWVLATADAINVRTANGIIHVLETTHPFGFGEFTRPQPEPYDKSTFRQTGYNGAFIFPAIVGQTTLIEAEDYDLGGEGVAYHDDLTKNGGNYRPNEFVDIDNAFGNLGQTYTDAAGTYPASYSLGWTKAGEWTIYSVNVPIDGSFQVISRVGNGNTTTPLKFHIEFDYKNVTGTLTFPNNKGWWVWQLVESPVIYLKAGSHTMRFFHETNDIQLNNFAVKRVN